MPGTGSRLSAVLHLQCLSLPVHVPRSSCGISPLHDYNVPRSRNTSLLLRTCVGPVMLTATSTLLLVLDILTYAACTGTHHLDSPQPFIRAPLPYCCACRHAKPLAVPYTLFPPSTFHLHSGTPRSSRAFRRR